MTQIQYLLFDLDDTLYTNASGLFKEVGERIEQWTARALQLTLAEAQALRAEYFAKYGTTMSGLLHHHPEVDIDDYLDDVHLVDVAQHLAPNLALDAMLARLPLPKFVFTNAITDWAERVLTQLGIRQHFAEIIDVRAVDYRGKPKPYAYEYTLARVGMPGAACVLLDDQPRNLEVGARYGMRTILVREGGQVETGVEFAVDDVLQAEPILQRLLAN